MMEEKNRESLRRALEQLPQHEPPADTWTGLCRRLSLEDLPAYTPPPAVWNELNGALDRQEQRSGRIRRLTRFSAAASLALLLGLGGWWYATADEPRVTIAYSQETAPDYATEPDWHEEDALFDQAFAELDDQSVQLEWEELEQARRDIEEMMERYGDDPQLIRQLADIERDRSDLYREAIY